MRSQRTVMRFEYALIRFRLTRALHETALAEDRLVLGLDVGTQSLRAALVDLQGRTVAFGVAPIETIYPRPTWAEQDPAQWWSAASDGGRRGPVESRRCARAGGGDRPRLHGLHGGRLRPGRQAAPSRLALDGSAIVPGGRRHQRHRRPRAPLRLGPGFARMDAAQGPLAQDARAGDLSPGRADRRVHRLDDVPADRRVDPVAQPCRGQVELCPARRRLAGRAHERGRAGRPAGQMARPDRSPGQGRCPARLRPRPTTWASMPERPWRRAESTPTSACSAWGPPARATWP